jgi:hypothetical protein
MLVAKERVRIRQPLASWRRDWLKQGIIELPMTAFRSVRSAITARAGPQPARPPEEAERC